VRERGPQCVGTVGSFAEVCNGLDDDCDGIVDGIAASCYPAGTAGCDVGTGVCQGICRLGTQTCTNGFFGTCVGALTPGVEIACNLIDDNCNGAIDETNGPEQCNGRDDDCDGIVDEGVDVTDPDIGDVCGTPPFVGACRPGTLQCIGGAQQCVGEVNPTTETCNNIDDDCDTRVDEGPIPGFGGQCCSDVGRCDPGTLQCANGGPQCVGQVGPFAEVCNGLDDNCNGQVDEGYASEATSCGVGACASTGSTSCSNGTVIDSCTTGSPAANDASCNNVDDDCDGQADEDYVSSATTCGSGMCGGTSSTQCINGNVIDTCTPQPATTVCRLAASACDVAETCDGVGNCPADSFQPQGTACDDGINTTVNDVCSGGLCQGSTCPSGSRPNAAGTACETLCSPGSFSATGVEPCNPCAAGTYTTETTETGAQQCTPCSDGTFSPTLGAQQCQVCPDGFRVNADNTACEKLCSPGSYSATGVEPCTLCPAGSYSAETGAQQCAECVDPTFTMAPGAQQCEPCPEGFRVNTDNTACEAPCAPGTYSASGFGQCQPCSPGTFSGQPGATACQACTCTGDQCHDAGTCDSITGVCSNPQKPPNTSCNDGDACTTGDACNATGNCSGATIACDDGNVCTTDSCDPANGCVHENHAGACDDGNACTQTDTCRGGVCAGGDPVICVASDACHDAGQCDPRTGTCSESPVVDGTPCDTGDLCNASGVCRAGVCVPACTTCEGSVSGGGRVMAASGEKATFNVSARDQRGADSGNFTWIDGKCHIKGLVTDMAICSDRRSASIQGTCGGGCSFNVELRDEGHADFVKVMITGGSCEGTLGEQPVSQGNIHVK
jgi:hypothetical protein